MPLQTVRLQLCHLEGRETPSVGTLAAPLESGDQLVVQTRTGHYFNSHGSVGRVSAIPQASFNPQFSDEVVRLIEVGGDGRIQSGDKVILKTRTGWTYNSYASVGHVSAIPQASLDPQFSDEVFTIIKLHAGPDPTIREHDKFLLRTRVGYYLNSYASVGHVSAIPQASFDPQFSDEIFSSNLVRASKPKTNIEIRGVTFVVGNSFGKISSVIINLAVFERQPSGANGRPVSGALVQTGLAEISGPGTHIASGTGRTDENGLLRVVLTPRNLFKGKQLNVWARSMFEAPDNSLQIDGERTLRRTT